MHRRRALSCAFLVAVATVAVVFAAEAADPAAVISHKAAVTLDVTAHEVRVDDVLELPAGLATLEVGSGFTIEAIDPAPATGGPAATPAADGEHQVIDLAALGLAGGGRLHVRMHGSFHQPTDEVTFSRENVGGEITATIGDEGVYLSSSAGWLPAAEGVMATHDLTVRVPAGFASVTQGRREVIAPEVTRWVADYPSDGINLIANRFVVHEEPVRDGVTAYTFFLEDDTDLRATYLERTRAYIEMYEEMIGPYPYAKFATVENWFPTGYGMPSYTLLGGQVLRLPFIPTTSFGHEIAHNWWGNSVFVDVERGNWCEGLTSWSADYHYKEMESPEAAREYRRNILKDYYAYVRDPAADFPLREFKSRHSGATRAVGYGKSMMLFHMLDRALGREAFLQGLRSVYAEHRFAAASWDDFLAAFAAAGGGSLDGFADQWLDRAGAPVLALGEVDFGDDEVTFVLQQAAPTYALSVPVLIDDDDGKRVASVELAAAEQRFTVKGRRPTRLVVDPGFDVFRRLHPQEVEPTLNQVLASEVPFLVFAGADPAQAEPARAFGRSFTDGGTFNELPDGSLPVDLPQGSNQSNLVVNPAADVAAHYKRDGLVVAGKTIVVEGKRYSLDQYDLVYTAPNPFDPTVTDLVVHCADPGRLEGLGRRLGHYGKYSWLLLPAGSGRVLRGNWPPASSPLVAVR